MRRKILQRGDHGPRVSVLREQLAAAGCPNERHDPEVFDDGLDHAVRTFQQARGLDADGIVGPETAMALDHARWRIGDRLLCLVPGHPMVGDDVAELQVRLSTLGLYLHRVDGILGEQTYRAVQEFQYSVGLSADGNCGPDTLYALGQLRRAVHGGDALALRDRDRVVQRGVTLAGRTVVLDAGHGGSDLGCTGYGLTEAEVTFDLVRRLEGRLQLSGVTTVLTRGVEQSPSHRQRALLASDVNADVLISVHCCTSDSHRAQGAATYYWGGGDHAQPSTVGRRLADLTLRELVARTGFVDCRSHPRTDALLRLTTVPAVRVELGYLSNLHDASQLASADVRDKCAEAMLVAVQRLFLPEDYEVATGVLDLSELEAQLAADGLGGGLGARSA